MRVQKQTKRVLYWGITLVLMILIFSFSAKNGTSSAGMSIGYAKELARILSFLGFFQIHSNADLMMHAEAVHTFVRKTAHFTEYAVLGFFTYKAVSCDVLDRKKAVLTAQLISTGYASTDEIHQMFVPGREGKVFDVMIDSCGAFCGICPHCLWQRHAGRKSGLHRRGAGRQGQQQPGDHPQLFPQRLLRRPLQDLPEAPDLLAV